jgi:signal transduction histidine kinase
MIIASSESDRIAPAIELVAPENGRDPSRDGHTNQDVATHGGHAPSGEPESHDGHADPAPEAAALHAATRLLAHERWQMATDVHDLIMQDLSLALANARALSDPASASSRADIVVGALERALAGARDVLGGLSEHDTRPIAQTIEASVRTAARHTPLRFDAMRVPSSAQPDRPTREALVHIAREAVTNAVKHARPSAIEVVLEHTGRWRLTVRDDGGGFEEAPGAAHAEPPVVGGFGLLSMRESAHALGGAVHVGSAAGAGTTVEAVLP